MHRPKRRTQRELILGVMVLAAPDEQGQRAISTQARRARNQRQSVRCSFILETSALKLCGA